MAFVIHHNYMAAWPSKQEAMLHDGPAALQKPGSGAPQVRNAASGIVQLVYGDDGLDPVAMEDKEGKPVDLQRLLSTVRAMEPKTSNAKGPVLAGSPDQLDTTYDLPLPAELEVLVARVLEEEGLAPDMTGYSKAFSEDVAAFLTTQVPSTGNIATLNTGTLE